MTTENGTTKTCTDIFTTIAWTASAFSFMGWIRSDVGIKTPYGHTTYIVAMMVSCFYQSFTGLIIDLLFDSSEKNINNC
jgi:hypothetical protein